ncbi:PTS sugar transporter subunit IIB [Nissabacter sp. SGAir0207]|uniref:PTS sugar transporter subunit IIB n=1 Tax=Nissabacter sp. SGAir0207 TaxID=2126321 RepID=UPI0010CD39BC|nr:PTS sugar transporter subunit IIB [Nissabacter sp. SGAir0207]QCR36686.1 PTS sugar transporter subunit IIB [Nissabacter sp. SGAir0207]
MKRIVLCCAAGMSTSMLVQRMRQEAEKRQLEVDIEAVPVSDFELIVKDADVILLGPQVKFQLKRLQEAAAPLNKPVDVIDMMDYGTMRGDKVLDKAIALMG